MKKNYYRLNLAIVSAFTDIERQFSSGRILNGNKLPVADRLIGQFGGPIWARYEPPLSC